MMLEFIDDGNDKPAPNSKIGTFIETVNEVKAIEDGQMWPPRFEVWGRVKVLFR